MKYFGLVWNEHWWFFNACGSCMNINHCPFCLLFFGGLDPLVLLLIVIITPPCSRLMLLTYFLYVSFLFSNTPFALLAHVDVCVYVVEPLRVVTEDTCLFHYLVPTPMSPSAKSVDTPSETGSQDSGDGGTGPRWDAHVYTDIRDLISQYEYFYISLTLYTVPFTNLGSVRKNKINDYFYSTKAWFGR